MNTRQLEPSERAEVEPLVERYPFKSYRHYRVLPRKKQTEVMIAEVNATLQHPDGVVLTGSSNGDDTLAVGRALAWDSAFFGLSMARIEYVCSPRVDLAHPLLTAYLDNLRARGVQHVSARADVADVELVAVLEACGFRLVDSLVTYTTRPRKEPPHLVREVGTIRLLREDDAAALLQVTADAYRGFRGRFHLDPHIPAERCNAFYVEWARQCLLGTMADTVLVAEASDGRPIGFLGFRQREPVSTVGGVPVFGGGLGACRADAPGAYAGLIRAGTIWAHERNAVAECQTQNYNFPTIRIYEAVGAHYVRAEYTLHCWLG